MYKYKVLLLIFILRNSVCHYGDNVRYEFAKNGRYSPNPCPGDKSHLSTKDIKDVIEHVLDNINVEENIVNSYFPKAVDINNKYLDELKDYQEKIVNRPLHLHHILDDLAKYRDNIEPAINKIVTEVKEIDGQGEKYNVLAKRSGRLLKQFDVYKEICAINCKNQAIHSELIHNNYIKMVSVMSPSTYICWQIEELYKIVQDKVNKSIVIFDEEISAFIEESNAFYENKVASYKYNLKNDALRKFGMTMYDILNLQDDYYHFAQELNEVQVSQQLEGIKKNNLIIEQNLVSLEKTVDKYKIHCMNCPSTLRMRQDVFDLGIGLKSETDDLDDRDRDLKYISDFIDDKINNIKEEIHKNLTNIYEELEVRLNDGNFIESHDNIILTLKELEEDIKKEQETFAALKNAIPQSSIVRIGHLLQASNELIKRLYQTKEFIDNVTQI